MRTIAKRYARSLLAGASLKEALQSKEELQAIKDNWKILGKFLINPGVSKKDKYGLIQQLPIAPLVQNLLSLLVYENRVDLFGLIHEELEHLAALKRSVLRARVVSALPLNDKVTWELQKVLEKKTAKSVEIQCTQEDIGGGLMIYLGNTLIDASIFGRLHRLRDDLIQSR